MGSFYRNLADKVDTFLGSDFYERIANDTDIPSYDVQKYILATSDFAKRMQYDINHYVTRDRINNASFRQKLDPISKNILRRQNPLELVFEDISTFDAENPIIGSLLRELDVKKKVLASDLIKGAPTPPGKDPEIQKRLDRLRDSQETGPSNNLSPPPSPPSFSPPPGLFIAPPPPPFQPPSSIFNSFQPSPRRPDNNFGDFHVPAQLLSASFPMRGPSDNLFGSQTAMLSRKKQKEKIV